MREKGSSRVGGSGLDDKIDGRWEFKDFFMEGIRSRCMYLLSAISNEEDAC